MTDRWRIIAGDCLAVMRDMEADSVDAVVKNGLDVTTAWRYYGNHENATGG